MIFFNLTRSSFAVIMIYMYSETSQNWPALGPKIIAGLGGGRFYETSFAKKYSAGT
jgi:hypothetical protein